MLIGALSIYYAHLAELVIPLTLYYPALFGGFGLFFTGLFLLK